MTDSVARAKLLWTALWVEGGLLLLAWALGTALGRPLASLNRWAWAALGWGLLASVPPLLWLAWLVRSRWGPVARLRAGVDGKVRPLFAQASLLDLALVALLAGVGEEALFRGALQPLLADWTGPTLAAVLVGVAFGLLHALTPAYAVYASLRGGYLGWLLLASDNLLVPAFVHALYDFAGLAVLARRPAAGTG